MQRSIALAFIASFLGAASAWSQPVLIRPPSYDATERQAVITTVPQPRAVATAAHDDLGGGFIEFLFGGHPRPQPMPDMQTERYIEPNETQQGWSTEANTPAIANPALEQPESVSRQMDPRYQRREVAYDGPEKAGTIVIDTPNKFLYLVEADRKALRYGVGVGRPGFTWSGVHHITAKKEWPDWVPPAEMLKRQPYLPHFMAGGPDNPLGARALYIGSTMYRIHGSNQPWTIGHDVSSGCIRLRNADVIDLYDRVPVGAKVVVT